MPPQRSAGTFWLTRVRCPLSDGVPSGAALQVSRPEGLPSGQLSPQEADTVSAIVDASLSALSICVIGVGDGPFDLMEEFDDCLKGSERLFDNFQFVRMPSADALAAGGAAAEADFALNALMEIPEQYAAIGKLGLLGAKTPSSGGARVRSPRACSRRGGTAWWYSATAASPPLMAPRRPPEKRLTIIPFWSRRAVQGFSAARATRPRFRRLLGAAAERREQNHCRQKDRCSNAVCVLFQAERLSHTNQL